MEKIKNFFKKWGNVIAIAVIILLLLFTLISCGYTIVVNTWIGLLGLAGAILAMISFIKAIILNIKSLK